MKMCIRDSQYVVLTMNAARLTDTHYAYTEANHVRRVETVSYTHLDVYKRQVYAAGDAADHLLVAHAFPNFPDEFPFKVSDGERVKVGRTGKEVAQDCAPFMGMGHFRMKLDAEGGFSPLEGEDVYKRQGRYNNDFLQRPISILPFYRNRNYV